MLKKVFDSDCPACSNERESTGTGGHSHNVQDFVGEFSVQGVIIQSTEKVWSDPGMHEAGDKGKKKEEGGDTTVGKIESAVRNFS